MTPKWYLAVAHRNSVLSSVDHDTDRALFRAEQELTSLGAQIYIPRETISVIRLNRRVKVDRTLLYNYLFVGIPETLDVHAIAEAKGIYRLLEDIDGNFAQVKERDVGRFRLNERRGLYDRTKRRVEPFKPNEKVKVLEGPFTGMTGLVRRCGRQNVVRVFLEGKHVVNFPLDHLVPA